MAMDLHLAQRTSLTQTMVMTPQLQQAIKLLQLNQLELKEEIYQEMLENPVLEMAASSDNLNPPNETSDSPREKAEDEAPAQQEDQFAEITGNTEEKIREEFDWENYLGEYSSSPSSSLGMGTHETPEETPGFESFTASRTSLTDHLTGQWRFVALNLTDYQRGETIIGNLNEDGYLVATLEEIAQMTNSQVKEVAETLARVQELDPAGVAARDLIECLSLQLERRGLKDDLAYSICQRHLKLLEKKDLPALCRALQRDKEEVLAAVDTLKSLDPRPARDFAATDPIYVIPDVYVIKVGTEYVISLNEDGLPKLRVNKAYKKMLSDKTAPDDTRRYLNEKLKGAVFLIRSIHQRQRTIFRVTESIFKFQRDFLDYGVDHLKPMVLKDVADDLGFHESTISRVTSNKYVDTPRGVFELKYFFDSPINRIVGDSSQALSSESVKNRIKQIIGAEDPKKPLSDQRIVEILHGSNISIARRTVAKYREILGYASSNERRQMF
ncbi:MAG: RNA polymerase factor sigma-54 [Deltaproteobacteria bacterium]|jgi:RNA polymerase sigma-54 factor|nr:RNA polymerase factor sigma-54 [Deltaproteobacteria bacterium]